MTFQKGHHIGSPKKYTPEFVENEAKELLKWCKKADSYYVTGFALHRGYGRQRMHEWSKENQVFADAYSLATQWQEFRLFTDSLRNKINPAIAKWGLACIHKWKEPEPEMSKEAQAGFNKFLELELEKYKKKLADGS